MIHQPKGRYNMATRNVSIKPTWRIKTKRSTSSPTTAIAENQAMTVQEDLSALVLALEPTDATEPKIIRVYVDIATFYGGNTPFRQRLFLAESLEGATLTNQNGTDLTVREIMDLAFTSAPFEYIPITDYKLSRCGGVNFWYLTYRVDITKAVRRWYTNDFDSVASNWHNLNLLVLDEQGQTMQTDVTTWTTIVWEKTEDHPTMSLVQTNKRAPM